jgi:hypothetical protein
MASARLIVLVALGALAVYVGITFVIPTPTSPHGASLIVPWVFLALAIVEFPLGLWMERRALKNTFYAPSAELTPEKKLKYAVVVSVGFGVAIGIYGFISFLINGERLWFWPLIGLSAVYLVLLYTRLEELAQLAEKSGDGN